MSPYILSVAIFFLLLGALAYYDLIPSYEALRQRMAMTKGMVLLLLLLFAVIAANLLFLGSGLLERYITALLFLLNFVFFLLLGVRGSRWLAFLVAITASEALVLSVFFFGEYANDILLLTGLVGAVTLLLKSGKVPDWLLVWLLVIMAIVGSVFVWVIPVIPAVDAGQQSLAYSLLFKVGSVSLGAGDITLLLIAILLLGRRVRWPRRAAYALILSQSVTVAYVFSTANFARENVFPFTVVLAPVFLFLYFVVKRLGSEGRPNAPVSL